jgi:hypothetical protein
MDKIDVAALQLKREYPRCEDVIDKEVDRLREEIAAEPHKPVAIQEDLINLRSRIQDYPCAQETKRRRAPGTKSGRIRGR